MDHDDLAALAAGYALDTLDTEETLELEAHLPGCAECTHLVAEMRALASVLPLAAEEQLPPPGLRDRIMASVRADVERSTGPEIRPLPQVSWWQYLLRPVTVASTAMAVLVAVVAITTWNSGGSGPPNNAADTALTQRRLDLSHRGIEIMAQADTWWQFSGTSVAPDAFGSLAFSENHGAACLVIYGLPATNDGVSYLAAVSSDGKPADIMGMWLFDSLVWVIIEGDLRESATLEITRVDPGAQAGTQNPVLFTVPLGGT
jgi:hypothetical protein